MFQSRVWLTVFLLLWSSIELVADVKLRLVPTYENCSVYVDGTTLSSDMRLEYREVGSEEWLRGHALVDSKNNSTPRTSLFGLKEGGSYEVRVLDGKSLEAIDCGLQVVHAVVGEDALMR